MGVQQIQYQTAQLIKLEFTFHFILYMYICLHEADAEDTQAEPSLPSRRLGVMSTARNYISLGQ